MFDVRTLKVFKNGLLLDEFEYEIVDNENIRFIVPLIVEDRVVIDYHKIVGDEL